MNFKDGVTWLIVGAALVLVGMVLAHLSNADMIHWSHGQEHVAHFVTHIAGFSILAIGLILTLVQYKRKR